MPREPLDIYMEDLSGAYRVSGASHDSCCCTGGSCGLQLLLLVHREGQQEGLQTLQQRQAGPYRHRLYMYICLGRCATLSTLTRLLCS